MKQNIGQKLALYPTPATVVGTVGEEGKVTGSWWPMSASSWRHTTSRARPLSPLLRQEAAVSRRLVLT